MSEDWTVPPTDPADGSAPPPPPPQMKRYSAGAIVGWMLLTFFVYTFLIPSLALQLGLGLAALVVLPLVRLEVLPREPLVVRLEEPLGVRLAVLVAF